MSVTPASTANRGFTLVELLIAVAILLILSGLTFGIARATRTHQDLDQAALQISHAFEYAKALAQSRGESLYFVIADAESAPAGAPLRAWTLLRRPENPEWIREWVVLPEGTVFAPDPNGAAAGDLILEEPLQRLSLPVSEASVVSGTLRVLVEITAEGRFVTAAVSSDLRLVLRRAAWFKDGTNALRLDPGGTAEMDAVRLRLRPLTGVVVQERVLP